MSYEDLGYDNLLGVPKTDKTVNSVNNQAFMEDGAIDLSQTSVSKIKVRQTISSENYQAGVSGWSINGDGSAEFRNVTIAGYKIYEAIIASDGTGNYTTIQDAVAAGAKKIFLRNGTYTLTADLNITNDNVSIEGETRDGVIITTAANYVYGIYVTGDNFTLSNLTLFDLRRYGNGNAAIQLTNVIAPTIANVLFITTNATRSYSSYGFQFYGCVSGVVKDCETRLCYGAANNAYSHFSFKFDTCTDFSVFNNLLSGQVAVGHIILSSCSRMVIDNNIISQTPHLGYTETFTPSAVNTTTNQITTTSPYGNVMIKFTTTGTLPAPLTTTDFYYFKYIDATHVTVHSSFDTLYSNTPIDLTDQGTGTHALNSFGQITTYGIQCYSGSDNIVSSNTISSTQYTSGYGIYSNENSLSINNNSVKGFGYGISCTAQNNNNICNNRISNSGNFGFYGGFASNAGYGCHVVSSNNIYKCLGPGIGLWPVVRAILSNNNVQGCLGHGFYGTSGGNFFDLTLNGNMFTYNGGSGIYISNDVGYYFSDSLITNNMCRSNQGYGIYMNGSYANIITSNDFNDNTLGTSSVTDSFSKIANNQGL